MFGKPFVIDTFKDQHRVVEMFQHMSQNDVVVTARKLNRLEDGIDVDNPIAAEFTPGLLNRGIRSLHTCYVTESLQKSAGEVSFKAAQFEQAAITKEGFEGTHHERVHDIEIERVSIPVIGGIAGFRVVVTRLRHGRG